MLNTTITAIIERLSGTTILIKVVHFEAPSISAASIISCGILCSKKLRTIIMLPTATPPGRNSAHMLSIKPVSLTIKYVGIRPPPKYIVIIKKILKNFLPGSSLILSGYAARYTMITEKTVPTTVYFILLRYPVIIFLSANTALYPSKVNSLGNKNVFPAYTSYGFETEAIST